MQCELNLTSKVKTKLWRKRTSACDRGGSRPVHQVRATAADLAQERELASDCALKRRVCNTVTQGCRPSLRLCSAITRAAPARLSCSSNRHAMLHSNIRNRDRVGRRSQGIMESSAGAPPVLAEEKPGDPATGSSKHSEGWFGTTTAGRVMDYEAQAA